MDARSSLAMLNEAQRLADSGRLSAVLDQLSEVPPNELVQSPTLALLFGIAQARLGHHATGAQWVATALDRSRERGDRTIEARALNVSGAIAFEDGRIDDAVGYFTRALAAAERDGDRAAVGRCSNNLGIIANLRGDAGRAVGSYTMALAAFQQVGLRRGVAETLQNLAITYRDQGDLTKALETVSRAVEEATAIGDIALSAQALGGQAEIRLLLGDVEMARREVERALLKHREIKNVVGEAEDLRVLANVLGEQHEHAKAETMLRDVIDRADVQSRPLLAAQAERDLARLLGRLGRRNEAARFAEQARDRFRQLGAEADVARLTELLESLRVK